MERFGRRVPLIVGGLWQSFWLFVFAAAGTAKNPTEDQNIGKLMIISACLFILGYASTWAREFNEHNAIECVRDQADSWYLDPHW